MRVIGEGAYVIFDLQLQRDDTCEFHGENDWQAKNTYKHKGYVARPQNVEPNGIIQRSIDFVYSFAQATHFLLYGVSKSPGMRLRE